MYYLFRGDITYNINQTIASKVIGITQPTLSNILNRKVRTTKMTAYCITKYLDENAEIEDYFERVK